MKVYMLQIMAGVGAAISIGLLAYFETTLDGLPLLMAPFGATAVLVFALPESPLAQPRNVILGHLITSLIGVFFVEFFDVTPITLAIATGLGVSAMLLSKTTHPPAGANPILVMATAQSWSFLITPVLIGAVIIVLIGKCMQKLQKTF